MTDNPVVFKVLNSHAERVEVDGSLLLVIPDGLLKDDELAQLKEEEERNRKAHQALWIANFLPDDIRPAGIKKL